MVLDARISYYFSIVVPSDCLLIPRPYLSGKIAHPRSKAQWNRSKPCGAVPPVYITAALSNRDIERRRFIHPVYSATWIDSPRVYPPLRIKIKSLPSSVLSALLSRIRWIRSDFSKPSTREIMTDNNKKGLKRIVFVERLIVCCSEYTQSLNETL